MKTSALVLIIVILASTTSQQPETKWLLSLRGAGPIRIGMSLSDVKKAISDSEAKLLLHPDDSDGVNGCTYLDSKYLPDGIGIMFDRQRVVRIDVEGGLVRTVSGIGIGDSEKDIIRSYPGRIRVEQHPYTNGHYLIYVPLDKREKDYGMIFETEDNRVTSFRAGLMNAVSLIEGCS